MMLHPIDEISLGPFQNRRLCRNSQVHSQDVTRVSSINCCSISHTLSLQSSIWVYQKSCYFPPCITIVQPYEIQSSSQQRKSLRNRSSMLYEDYRLQNTFDKYIHPAGVLGGHQPKSIASNILFRACIIFKFLIIEKSFNIPLWSTQL